MSDRLTASSAWNRARALKLHEHFQSAALAVQGGAKIGDELDRVLRLLDGLLLQFPGGETILKISWTTINREWGYWNKGGREGKEHAENIRRPEALLLAYKAGCGGHKPMPRKLVAELQRRMTHTTGGRDKFKRSPISVAWDSIKADFKARRPLPGIDYDDYEIGAELPWHYSTACRKKAPRTLRAAGNLGASAAKNVSAYVSLDYSKLRKGELYTLDDVRLDIVCIDETGAAIEVVLYVFMEVASRMIVGYVMKPAAHITQEDVDELLSHMLQVPGFGIGIGYVTHILFERGAVACTEAAQALIEGVTDGNVKCHRTGMVGGVRWIGTARDKARGNAAGKAVIESFNRWLHYALLHLPGQRGNKFENQPENMGDMSGGSFLSSTRQMKGTLIDHAEQLAQFEFAGARRLKLRLPMLRLFELHDAVRGAIARHNTEPGHDYRGHGEHFEAEVRPGVWESTPQAAPSKRQYTLHTGTAIGGAAGLGKREIGIYWGAWSRVAKARPDLDRHAVTRRVLGYPRKHTELTRAEWAQLLTAFAAIVREAKTAAPSIHQS